ncbi:hypothetical protein PHPALM_27493, partial [Phytophthora palmivora]
MLALAVVKDIPQITAYSHARHVVTFTKRESVPWRNFTIDPTVVQSYQARRDIARDGGENVKLGRSPVWKPVRDERSSYCIYAYVEKQSEATVNQLIDPIDNT